jgi:hypothetical protein
VPTSISKPKFVSGRNGRHNGKVEGSKQNPYEVQSDTTDNSRPRGAGSRNSRLRVATKGSDNTKKDRGHMSNGKGSKQDPYEVPSDTMEDARVHMVGSQNSLRIAPRLDRRALQSTPKIHRKTEIFQLKEKTTAPATQRNAAPVNAKPIPRNDKVIWIEDSSSEPDDSCIPSYSSEVPDQVGKSRQKQTKATDDDKRPFSAALGKRPDPYTVNSHLSIVEKEDKTAVGRIQATGPNQTYSAKGSQSVVPSFTKGEPSDRRNSSIAVPTNLASSTKSINGSASDEPLTLTPSRVAGRVKTLHAQFQREIKEHQAAEQQAVEQQAQREESRKQAEAEMRRNLPSSAIAHVQAMTKAGISRKG